MCAYLEFLFHTHTHTHTHRNKVLKNQKFKTQEVQNQSLQTQSLKSQEFKTQDLRNKALKSQNLKSSNKSLSKDKSKLKVNFANVALYFIKNEGQYNKQALFYAKTPKYTLWVTKNGLVFDTVQNISQGKKAKRDKSSDKANKFVRDVSRLKFIGANFKVKVISLDKQDLKVNYFKGKDEKDWKSVDTSAAVLYQNIYPNIDLKVYGTGGQIEYDWIVKKGGNPQDIRFEYSGIKNSSINKAGDIEIDTQKIGKLIHKNPVSYQEVKGKKISVSSSFINVKDNKNQYCIAVKEYDKSKTLVIDPVIALKYSTCLGGSQTEYVYAIAVDSSGYVYVTGITQSSDFPL